MLNIPQMCEALFSKSVRNCLGHARLTRFSSNKLTRDKRIIIFQIHAQTLILIRWQCASLLQQQDAFSKKILIGKFLEEKSWFKKTNCSGTLAGVRMSLTIKNCFHFKTKHFCPPPPCIFSITCWFSFLPLLSWAQLPFRKRPWFKTYCVYKLTNTIFTLLCSQTK